MKVVKLSDDDHTLLVAAHAACEDSEEALDKAHKNNKQVREAYHKVLDQLKLKYKLEGQASDDQQFLLGHPAKPADGIEDL